MTVSVASANNSAFSATSERRLGTVDVRGSAPVAAGTVVYDAVDLVTGWHRHDLHQLEYAFGGTAEVETAAGRYLLPPRQAIWIPADLEHSTTLRGVRSIAVFFDPRLVDDPGDRARVLAATPLLREMIIYATRWPVARAASDPVADAFFDALARLTSEWLDSETPLWLPTANDPLMAAVIAHTVADLRANVSDVCRAVGLSPRTLSRRFPEATGMTWHAYRAQARLLTAITLLARTDHTVVQVATTSGFDSISAFGRAFTHATGETPTAYRRRITETHHAGPRRA
ncbi:MAG: helix-turn-helix domain-containing protein [Acidimicrobiales bacterium]